MDTVSSLAIAAIFFTGVSSGALITALYRHIARERLVREFESRLSAIVESQARLPRSEPAPVEIVRSAPAESTAASRSTSATDDLVEIDDHEEELAWIPSSVQAAKPQHVHL